jgi:hypothetical protein
MTGVTVDVAGGPMGGAARFRAEFYSYLARTGRKDVKVIGANRRTDPSWLLRREVVASPRTRRVALNNVGFVAPGGQRWTLLRNALHFLLDGEQPCLPPGLVTTIRRQSVIIRAAAQRSDVIVVPCTSMAERVTTVVPSLGSRIVIRPHPVSADSIPRLRREPAILCPVLFDSYKPMADRLKELLAAMDNCCNPAFRLRITADATEAPPTIAQHPRTEFVGRLSHQALRSVWGSSRAIYFPTHLESFGYPLAEARVSGHPVIGLDTAQNREVASQALCGFTAGDEDSLRRSVERAVTVDVAPDPASFDPDAYFNWALEPSGT